MTALKVLFAKICWWKRHVGLPHLWSALLPVVKWTPSIPEECVGLVLNLADCEIIAQTWLIFNQSAHVFTPSVTVKVRLHVKLG